MINGLIRSTVGWLVHLRSLLTISMGRIGMHILLNIFFVEVKVEELIFEMIFVMVVPNNSISISSVMCLSSSSAFLASNLGFATL